MSRYLSPSKITLLTLLSLYVDSLVPVHATVPILSFIIDQLVPQEAPSSNYHSISPSKPRTFILPIEQFQNACADHASAVTGRTIWDLLLRRLWHIDSLERLHEFFEKMGNMLALTREELRAEAAEGAPRPPSNRILFSRASPVGGFVRRAQLEFVRYQFHNVVALWKSFIAYRQSTWPAWKKRNQSASRLSFDTNLDDPVPQDRLARAMYGGEPEQLDLGATAVSTEDLERLLEFQVDEMQKLGNRITDEIKSQLRLMLESNITLPSLSHYVKFLDTWRAGDYPSSFEHLHRYFDYTMQNRDRTFYQYALLNLAILQADFHCHAEAVAAMQETICAARENKDMGCLNFSLSWLYHFGKAHPTDFGGVEKRSTMSIEREGLAFLRAKAREAGMWSLWSTSILSEAKLILANGESVAEAFENILKSSHINVVKGMTNVLGAQMLLQSSIWTRLGVGHLAWSHCEMFLQCYAGQAPVEDVLKCLCRSAYIARPAFRSLAQAGRYEEALAKMQEISSESLRVLRIYQYWTIFSGVIRLRRELYRNNLRVAEHLCSQLLAQESTEPDIAIEIRLLEIDLLVHRGAYTQALSNLERMSRRLADEHADIYHRIRLLNIKAHLLSRSGVVLKGFSLAVRAASIAWRAQLLPPLWDALGAIANVLVHLKEFDAAAQLLVAIIPQVLECDDAALSARSYAILGDAQMGLASRISASAASGVKFKEQVNKTTESIDRAFEEYSRIEDIEGQCEMLAKKASIMNLVGDAALAEDYAARYLDLKRASQARLE
ncbi:MAG: anaphase promoting complex subunit 5 [Phylliscum demangeonii]|nr:MAG: anaphase promoting complex subunit 5 [Phylliscum demangeonii]